MIKARFLLLHIFCLACFWGISQENGTDRKGRFHFSIGPEYRITPFYSYDTFSFNQQNFSGYTNIDKQNSGTAVNVDVEYFITKNFGIGFSNSFRYDLVHGGFTTNEVPLEIKEAEHRLIFDYSLYLSYYFKIFKTGELYINAGVSFMNRNTDFTILTTTFNEDGSVFGTGIRIGDYHYSANRITIGYKKNKVRVYGGIFTTIQAPYFDATTRFNVPFVGCSFDIGKL